MASALPDVMDTLRTTFEGTTPPTDGSGASYEVIDTLTLERGNAKHRQLCWVSPTSARLVAETPIHMEWDITLELTLSRRDRTHDAFVRAIAEEINRLCLAYSGVTSWGNSNVLEVHLDGVTLEIDNEPKTPRSGGVPKDLTAVVGFNLRVLTQEI